MKIWAKRLPVRFCSSNASVSCVSPITPASSKSSPRRLVDFAGRARDVAIGTPQVRATVMPRRQQTNGARHVRDDRVPPLLLCPFYGTYRPNWPRVKTAYAVRAAAVADGGAGPPPP